MCSAIFIALAWICTLTSSMAVWIAADIFNEKGMEEARKRTETG
jgi:hypothetical protein